MLLLTFWHNDRAICCLLSIFAHINTLGSCEIGSNISIIIQAMKKLSHVLLTFLVGVLCTLNTTRLHAVTTRHYLNGCQLSSRFSTIYIFLGFSPDSPYCVSYSHLIGYSWWRHQPRKHWFVTTVKLWDLWMDAQLKYIWPLKQRIIDLSIL